MCTAINLTVNDNYFGRNLDYEHSFGEKIVITPRHYPFKFTNGQFSDNHSALIGTALIYNDFPLYFDASNEYGLSAAGLNFPNNAFYPKSSTDINTVAVFEFIPFILTGCRNTVQVRDLLKRITITDNASPPASPLHWLIADKHESITIEQTIHGLNIYSNPVGVLTNNPEFNMQMFNLNNYFHISATSPKNLFSDKLMLKEYSRGLGAIGLPGDLSSMSRFVKACFVKLNSIYSESEAEIVNQFFHILYSVYQPKGTVKINDKYEITNYTSCCNTDKGIYYYTTYNNSRINAVSMYHESLNSDRLISFNMQANPDFYYQN